MESAVSTHGNLMAIGKASLPAHSKIPPIASVSGVFPSPGAASEDPSSPQQQQSPQQHQQQSQQSPQQYQQQQQQQQQYLPHETPKSPNVSGWQRVDSSGGRGSSSGTGKSSNIASPSAFPRHVGVGNNDLHDKRLHSFEETSQDSQCAQDSSSSLQLPRRLFVPQPSEPVPTGKRVYPVLPAISPASPGPASPGPASPSPSSPRPPETRASDGPLRAVRSCFALSMASPQTSAPTDTENTSPKVLGTVGGDAETAWRMRSATPVVALGQALDDGGIDVRD